MRTRLRHGRRAIVPAMAAVAIFGGWAAARNYPVVVPGIVQSVEGNSDNRCPFNGDPMRYQQVFAAAEFPSGPYQISRLTLRPDANNGAAFAANIADIQINLSTT